MSTFADAPTKSRDAPENYLPVSASVGSRLWEHNQTGLQVELFRYARFYHRTDPTPDYYEFQLAIRHHGRSARVDQTTTNYGEGGTDNDPVGMAREWMRAHPDGKWEGAH